MHQMNTIYHQLRCIFVFFTLKIIHDGCSKPKEMSTNLGQQHFVDKDMNDIPLAAHVMLQIFREYK